jgi:ABC-type multidrug transport system fused ATPase/permease subunit
MKMRSTMITTTYRKLLETSVQSRDSFGSGKLLTLMTQDPESMYAAGYMCARVLNAPLVCGVGIYFAVDIVGYAPVLCGVAVLLLFVPIMMMIGRAQRKRQQSVIKETGVRTTHLRETIYGIKMIKMYAWIKPLLARVGADRDAELVSLAGYSYLKNLSLPLAFMLPSMASIVTLVVYATLGT